ncbi:MAG TPA: DNA-formamidopyrimidine glycosylase family protein [Acidimicrobiales bacterium]|nr:DNA-formamidopyrimidine glycosylase family protein [Acidimicrobiales bacterium]
MPELPEVRAHAERLHTAFAGTPLDKLTALSFHAMKTFDPPPEAAISHALTAVRQRGKYLLLDFTPITFVIHLMQGGRLRVDEKQAAKVRGGLVRIRFVDGRALLLTEAGTDHKAGVWVRSGDALTQDPLDRLGPDADSVTTDELAQRLRATNSMRLHGWLREQGPLAGLGRRLANEVCWQAKISPFANTRKLGGDDVVALQTGIHAAIDEGLAYERTRNDMSASKDRPGAVHGRTKEPCPRCGDAIRAVEYSSYTVNYCATCQTGGKVLADNTTSRFLK